MHRINRYIVVAVSLEGLVMAQIGIAVCTSVVALIHLGLVSLIPTVGILATVIRVVGMPHQAVDNLQRGLRDIL